MHYTEDALLQEATPFNYQITFKEVIYRPTAEPEVLGTLLFGLRPRGIRFYVRENFSAFFQHVTFKAHVLHLHANGKKWDANGLRLITTDVLREWVNAAVALAPDAVSAGQARKLIDENLGPYAYDDFH